jgi:hypothetical protein
MWIDFRYVWVEPELWALKQMLASVEPTIRQLGRAFESRTLGELDRSRWADDPAERSLANQTIEDLRDFVLPYQLCNGYLLMLWAGYELCLGSIGAELTGHLGRALRPTQAFGPPIEKSKAAFRRLGVALDPDSDRLGRLQDLYEMRSAIAHAGSRRQGLTAERWSELLAIASRYPTRIDRARQLLLAEPGYLRSAYSDVATSLRGLVERAKARVPAAPAGDGG